MTLPKSLDIKARIQISKTTHQVFEAIVDPDQMSNYFIEKGSARLETDKTVEWKWPEFDGEYEIRVKGTEQDALISFVWDNGGRETLVEITLTDADGSTIVNITEKSMPLDAQGLAWLGGNSEGWGNFLACLKAWLEYGINLRNGAFDFMKETPN